MKFYKENAKSYIEQTISLDMSPQYEFVRKYLKEDSKILDVGFGSGRDMLHFKNEGYDVYGIDLEDKFVKHAKELGLNVEQGNVLTYKSNKRYDLIWCCASLLHLEFNDIKNAINNLKTLLSDDGVIYISLKYGDFEGDIGGRYFTYINDVKLNKLDLNIIEKTVTVGINNQNLKWLNLIIK